MLTKTTLRNLTILLGSITIVMATTIIAPSLPGMLKAFADVRDADFLVRLTLTMPALFIAIGAIFAGFLLDLWGRKPVLILSLILYGFAGTSGFFLESLPAILVSRAVFGLAVAGIMGGFTTLILDYFDGDERNKMLGMQAAVMGFGSMVFIFIAGILADIGWQYPFLFHLFALLILPGAILFIDEPDRTGIDKSTDTEKVQFPWRKLAPIYATGFLGMVLFFIFPVQIPFYLSANSGVSSSQVGLAFSLQSLSSVVFALLYQRIKARYTFIAIFSLIFLSFSLNHLIIASSSAYLVALLGLFIGGIGIGLFPPNINGWLASIAPAESRGRAVGGLFSILLLGQFFSPILTQPVISQAGLTAIFFVAGVVGLLIAFIFGGSVAKQQRATNSALEQNP